MDDTLKSKEELIHELSDLRKKIAELEQCALEYRKSHEDLQQQVVEYEKLSALGRLTANVAHEIRNPITVIGGLSHRLKSMFTRGSREKGYVDLIELETKRLEGILRDALLFSDKIFFRREELDINELISGLLASTEPLYRTASIVFDKEFGAIPPIYIDSDRFKEAVKNLIVNAFDAMPHGGTITVATSQTSVKGKPYIALKISDTGTGIPADRLDMIFEPFYTTKANSADTGLGLPITKKIIEGHGGFIKVDSTPGKGTTFTLFFPYRPD